MKKYLTLSLLAIGLTLASCDSKSSLAKDMSGSWAGAPERINSPQTAATITCTDTYDFIEETGIAGGNVTIAGMMSVSAPMLSSGDTGGYSISAAANTTISGTWTVTDEDEVEMILDPRSLTVNIDPDALELRTDSLGVQAPQVDSIAPGLTDRLRQLLTGVMEEHYLSQRHLDDVEVSDNVLKFDVETPKAKDKKIVLRRQQ
ncbi:MAG: hypothetical protein K2M57_02960 [Paramuribaculum sp.]|nr:hypothetical protein [Paramuribaculum sp.]